MRSIVYRHNCLRCPDGLIARKPLQARVTVRCEAGSYPREIMRDVHSGTKLVDPPDWCPLTTPPAALPGVDHAPMRTPAFLAIGLALLFYVAVMVMIVFPLISQAAR